MKHLMCMDCGAPFNGTQIPRDLPPICQVCNSDNMREVELEKKPSGDPLEEK